MKNIRTIGSINDDDDVDQGKSKTIRRLTVESGAEDSKKNMWSVKSLQPSNDHVFLSWHDLNFIVPNKTSKY